MELMRLTQLLGSLGEFVGAIAVVVTPGYLAVQVRQNSLQVRENASASGWKRPRLIVDDGGPAGRGFRTHD